MGLADRAAPLAIVLVAADSQAWQVRAKLQARTGEAELQARPVREAPQVSEPQEAGLLVVRELGGPVEWPGLEAPPGPQAPRPTPDVAW